MKHKTAELTGALLDDAVALIEDVPIRYLVVGEGQSAVWNRPPWSPSTNWEDGGPIIERERLSVLTAHPGWEAFHKGHTSPRLKDAEGIYGPTYLVAAMRCFVASKFGDEVDL